ncbi:helix-turn-helix domain-containing protein [Pseudoflavitalea rhizosphaerae]|uniref:helix-turn-helix domain-containing protein n=1 Tax=Pseudoflavitalea rhizosphaerae TaxID=1884793 RepID=UPI000F8CAD97|nr:helix-turn-helix domain-containing protein [Pseudoflavitalea rhizosphaerae]
MLITVEKYSAQIKEIEPKCNFNEELLQIEDYINSHPTQKKFTQYFMEIYKSDFPSIKYYFKRKHKKTIEQYVITSKADLAEKLLKSGFNTLYVAKAIGLTQASVNRLITKKTGLTPSEIIQETGKASQKQLSIIEEVKVYIARHIDNRLSATRISETLHHFKKTIKNLFLQYEGVDLAQYIDQRRIERAKQLLIDGHSLNEVSVIMNYSYLSSFIVFFKTITGITPGEYLQSIQGQVLHTGSAFKMQKKMINEVRFLDKVTQILNLVDEYVLRNIDNIVNDQAVASYFKLNVKTLRKRYREYKGEILNKVIQRHRVERIKFYLIEGNTVHEIASKMNFKLPSLLTSFFVRKVHQPPTRFQNSIIGVSVRHMKYKDQYVSMLAELELLIRNNLELNNTIKALALKYGMGVSNIRYHFLKSRGFSVGDFLAKCKLENAVNLMLKQVPLLEAAKSSKFRTIGGFYKTYVSYYGEHSLSSIFRMPS